MVFSGFAAGILEIILLYFYFVRKTISGRSDELPSTMSFKRGGNSGKEGRIFSCF